MSGGHERDLIPVRIIVLDALEEGARRATQGLDMPSEAAFRRLIAQVFGVTRTLVRKVSSRREIGEAQRPALTQVRVEPQPVEDDPDDAEALADFDREN